MGYGDLLCRLRQQHQLGHAGRFGDEQAVHQLRQRAANANGVTYNTARSRFLLLVGGTRTDTVFSNSDNGTTPASTIAGVDTQGIYRAEPAAATYLTSTSGAVKVGCAAVGKYAGCGLSKLLGDSSKGPSQLHRHRCAFPFRSSTLGGD